MRRLAAGSTRRTSNSPRLRTRGWIVSSIGVPLAVPASSLTESPPQLALHSQGIMAYDPYAYFVHLTRLAAARGRGQRSPPLSGGARPAPAGAVGRHRAFRTPRYPDDGDHSRRAATHDPRFRRLPGG